jgi:hypothetical protein
MPKQYITFRAECDYRHANVPYWTGAGGIIPPGRNSGAPAIRCLQQWQIFGANEPWTGRIGARRGTEAFGFRICASESFIDLAIMVKF